MLIVARIHLRVLSQVVRRMGLRTNLLDRYSYMIVSRVVAKHLS